ncbi:P-loop containing nucleoside triphosphate hydrolase protein [Aspergillus pseudodeflectus]|uniref:P-loop containing nucleoside triphosphate hydrolase protein n=1 Tax=Aspergillus pseudodeflectus TaxID=176178 RepID=A0ABR4KS41_9EURO
MSNSPRRLKIVMFGDDRVGKSAFLQRYARREFLAEYSPFHQPKFYTIAIEFNNALVTFDIWDIPPGIPSDDLTRDSDGAILMFDLQRPSTYESIPRYYTNMLPVFSCKDRLPIPVVICGNKVDYIERKVKPPQITYHREKGLQYYDFSVKSLYNFEKPLLFLARRILGEPELEYAMVPDVGEQLERERRGEQ